MLKHPHKLLIPAAMFFLVFFAYIKSAEAWGCTVCAISLPVIATNTGITAGTTQASADGTTPWKIWRAIKMGIQELQAADRTLVAMEDMYYMVEAFTYLHDNGGILGAVSYMSQATSLAAGMASQGLSAYQTVTGSFAPSYSMSPTDYASALGNMAMFSSMTGALANSANTLGMISSENSGVPFLEVVNGAQLGVQAALTTTQAIDNWHQYQLQKDQQAALQAQAEKVAAEQKFMSQSPQFYTVPCDNMAASVTVFTTSPLSTNGTLCTTVGAPGLNVITATGTGINKTIASQNQAQCISSMASVVAAGQPAPNCSPAAPSPVWNGPNPNRGGGSQYGEISTPYSFGGGLTPMAAGGTP